MKGRHNTAAISISVAIQRYCVPEEQSTLLQGGSAFASVGPSVFLLSNRVHSKDVFDQGMPTKKSGHDPFKKRVIFTDIVAT